MKEDCVSHTTQDLITVSESESNPYRFALCDRKSHSGVKLETGDVSVHFHE